MAETTDVKQVIAATKSEIAKIMLKNIQDAKNTQERLAAVDVYADFVKACAMGRQVGTV